MKITLKKEKEIIVLPDDFSFLQKIMNNKYVYEIKYLVDVSRALQNKATTAKIVVYSKPTKTSVKTSVNPTSATIQEIQQRSAISKSLAASQENPQIAEKISDITSVIPNDKVSALYRGVAEAKTTRTISLARLKDLSAQGLSVPVYSVAKPSEVSSVLSAQELSFDLIHEKHQDPSVLGTRNRTNATVGSLMAGVYQPTTVSQNAFISSATTALNQEDIVPIQTTATSNYYTMNETILLDITAVKTPEVFVVINLYNNNGVVIETITGTIEHAKNVAVLKTPVLAPVVKTLVCNKEMKNTLFIKQVDPNAVGVKILKRLLNVNQFQKDATYSFVADFPLVTRNGEQKFTDTTSNYNPAIYRVIPYGENGVLASEFSGVVCRANKHSLKPRVALVATGDSTSVKLEITEIPAGFLSVAIYRKTPGQKKTLVETPRRLGGLQTNSITFTDTSVTKNKTYFYSCELLSKNNLTHEAATIVYQHSPETSSLVEVSYDNFQVISSDDVMDVRFKVSFSFKETNETRIKNEIDRLGLANLFGGDVSKENLQNLVAHRVTRTNLTTGEQEEFGLLTNDLFSDAELRELRNVKPLMLGCEYRYTITTFFTPITTSLSNYVQTVTNTINPNLSYSFSPAKWKHPIVSLYGNIGNAASIKANHAQNEYTFGTVGKIISVDASFKESLPNVLKASASLLNKKLVKIQWRTHGNTNKIDHYLISMIYLGNKSIVGKCHNISDSGLFQFVDVLDSGERGSLLYQITPVFYDFSRGKETTTNRVQI